MTGRDILLDNEPKPLSLGAYLGQMARERLSEFRRVRTELADVDSQITGLNTFDNPTPGQRALLDGLHEQRLALRATGALDPVTNLVNIAIAETFDPSPPSYMMYAKS